MLETGHVRTSRWNSCWKITPEIRNVLSRSTTLEEARKDLEFFLDSKRRELNSSDCNLAEWKKALARKALEVFHSMISETNEKAAKNSVLQYVWQAAVSGDADVSLEFIQEMEHLFRALSGKGRVYPSVITRDIEETDFSAYEGREAAVIRSEYLDRMGDRMDEFLKRYPSGLEAEVDARRQENKKRILKEFAGNEDCWWDYRWHFRHVIRDRKGIDRMLRVIDMDPEQRDALYRAVDNGVPFGVTPHYLHLMDKKPGLRDFAVRHQVFPPADYVDTMADHIGDRSLAFDFMRERDTSPVEHITRRYVKVSILKPYDTCPQICVYCQRNWEITQPFAPGAEVAADKIEKAVEWIETHPHIMDLLITGGDPLVMSNNKINALLMRLAAIPHLKSIRIATRFPVTVPQRFDSELVDILSRYNEPGRRIIYVVTHIEHPYELCRESVSAVNKLRSRGIGVYNQQVFTFANSRRFESAALRIALKLIGIDPYYVFNMKGKSEMEDYAVPLSRLLQERKEEARLLPGIYRTDEPVFNVPFLGKNHVRAWQDHKLISVMPDGRRVYSFFPWERNIRGVSSYIYKDVSIGSYLKKLEQIGEDPEDYASIWYYC